VLVLVAPAQRTLSCDSSAFVKHWKYGIVSVSLHPQPRRQSLHCVSSPEQTQSISSEASSQSASPSQTYVGLIHCLLLVIKNPLHSQLNWPGHVWRWHDSTRSLTVKTTWFINYDNTRLSTAKTTWFINSCFNQHEKITIAKFNKCAV